MQGAWEKGTNLILMLLLLNGLRGIESEGPQTQL